MLRKGDRWPGSGSLGREHGPGFPDRSFGSGEQHGGVLRSAVACIEVHDFPLASIGAQQRGETLDEFMQTRNVPLRQNK